MLQIPLEIKDDDTNVCNIKKKTAKTELLMNTDVLVWDEISMMHKKGVEAVNRSLKDIRENDTIMGGILVILAGDFRQTLPVVKRGTMVDEINACFKSSKLWKYVQTFHLEENMRIRDTNNKSKEFAKYLLTVGNGTANSTINYETIYLNQQFGNMHTTHQNLLESVYPNLNRNLSNYQWISERAILAVTNEIVDNINFEMIQKVNGESRTYFAVDSVSNDNDTVLYPQEFLNSLQPCGMTQFKLPLKIGVPIMLLRNLDPPRLCNGTRLVIKKLYNYIIEATIITGQYRGQHVLIPRIPLISNDSIIEFKRLQFPIKIGFAMTINKSQGQSFNEIGIDVQQEVFTHGQLYVAITRVTNPEKLHILTKDSDSLTKNIVYKNVLS